MDFGALTTVGWLREKQGFKKEPYASLQYLTANYSTSRQSFTFRYSGDFKKVFGSYDLLVNAIALGPKNLSNFFGVGNETEFINPGKEGIEYYRSRYDLVNADVRIKKQIGRNLSWNAGVAGQYYTSSMSDNVSRYLGAYDQQNPSDNVFASRFFAGLCAGLDLQTFKADLLHSTGIHFTADIKGMKESGGEGKSFRYHPFLFYREPAHNKRYRDCIDEQGGRRYNHWRSKFLPDDAIGWRAKFKSI
jgi:hypothetical protein